MPIFSALYYAISRTEEIRTSSFLYQSPDVAAVEDDHRGEGGEMKKYEKREIAFLEILAAVQQSAQQRQMAGARDRQKFGYTLYYSEQKPDKP